MTGLAGYGYHTACIGGVGFFNKLTPLSHVLPSLFAESHWHRELGVTDPHSTANQISLALSIIEQTPANKPLFLFINISALHQPNHFYLPRANNHTSNTIDTIASHAAALQYVDSHLPPLFAALRQHRPTFCILCADHGTAYGEDGFTGHRIGHPVVWTVPYAEFCLD